MNSNTSFFKIALVEYFGGVQEWCLYLDPWDFDTANVMHSRVTKTAFLKELNDPHLQKFVGDGLYPSALKLGTDWIKTIGKQNRPIFINSKGGWFPVEGAKVIKYAESENFPVKKTDAEEVFTISRWLDGNHWYISSNNNTLMPDKFNTFEEAENWCKNKNPLASIKEEIKS